MACMKLLSVFFFSVLAMTCHSQTLTPKQQGELWGLVNDSGQFVVQPIYEKIYPYHHGVAYVLKNKSIGAIDVNGKEIIRCIYGEAPLKFGLAAFQPNYKGERQYISWFAGHYVGDVWIDQNGKILVTNSKRVYTVTDRIPISEALWDY